MDIRFLQYQPKHKVKPHKLSAIPFASLLLVAGLLMGHLGFAETTSSSSGKYSGKDLSDKVSSLIKGWLKTDSGGDMPPSRDEALKRLEEDFKKLTQHMKWSQEEQALFSEVEQNRKSLDKTESLIQKFKKDIPEEGARNRKAKVDAMRSKLGEIKGQVGARLDFSDFDTSGADESCTSGGVVSAIQQGKRALQEMHSQPTQQVIREMQGLLKEQDDAAKAARVKAIQQALGALAHSVEPDSNDDAQQKTSPALDTHPSSFTQIQRLAREKATVAQQKEKLTDLRRELVTVFARELIPQLLQNHDDSDEMSNLATNVAQKIDTLAERSKTMLRAAAKGLYERCELNRKKLGLNQSNVLVGDNLMATAYNLAGMINPTYASTQYVGALKQAVNNFQGVPCRNTEAKVEEAFAPLEQLTQTLRQQDTDEGVLEASLSAMTTLAEMPESAGAAIREPLNDCKRAGTLVKKMKQVVENIQTQMTQMMAQQQAAASQDGSGGQTNSAQQGAYASPYTNTALRQNMSRSAPPLNNHY